MNRFNQTKRALALTMALMVGVCYMPAFAFAGSAPNADDFAEKTFVSDETKERVTEAVKDANDAIQEVLADAAKAEEKQGLAEAEQDNVLGTDEVVEGETQHIDGYVDTNETLQKEAEGKYTEAQEVVNTGNNYVKDQETKLADTVANVEADTADAKDAAVTAKGNAVTAKDAAEAALANAKAATTQKQVNDAAEAAAQAAADAAQAAADANDAYQEALAALNTAKGNLEDVKTETATQVAKYNEEIGNLQAGAEQKVAALAAAEAAYETALGKAVAAKNAAAEAALAAERANIAANEAKQNALNAVHVAPAQAALDAAKDVQSGKQTAYNTANDNLGTANKNLQDAKDALKNYKDANEAAYNANVATIADGDTEVEEWHDSWGAFWRAIVGDTKTKVDVAKETSTNAQAAINSANKTISDADKTIETNQAIIDAGLGYDELYYEDEWVSDATVWFWTWSDGHYESVEKHRWIGNTQTDLDNAAREISRAEDTKSKAEVAKTNATNAKTEADGYIAAYDAAKTAKGEYEFAIGAEGELQQAINSADSVQQAAQRTLNAANSELNDANAAVDAAQLVYDAACQTRDEYVAEVKEALKANETDTIAKLTDVLKAEVAKTRSDLKETEYDAACYEWACDWWNWRIISQGIMRGNIDDKYNDELNSLFNAIKLTTGLSDTEDIIKALESTFTDALIHAEEEVEYTRAYEPTLTAETALADAQAAAEAAAVAAQAVADAEQRLTDARTAAETAAENLANLERVKGISQTALDAAQAELDKAQANVDDAKQAYDDAVAAKNTADAALKEANKVVDFAKDIFKQANEKGALFRLLLPSDIATGNKRPTLTGSYEDNKTYPRYLDTGYQTFELSDLSTLTGDKKEWKNEDTINFGLMEKSCYHNTYKAEYVADPKPKYANNADAAGSVESIFTDEQLRNASNSAITSFEAAYPEKIVKNNGKYIYKNEDGKRYEITGIDWYIFKHDGAGFTVDGDFTMEEITVNVNYEFIDNGTVVAAENAPLANKVAVYGEEGEWVTERGSLDAGTENVTSFTPFAESKIDKYTLVNGDELTVDYTTTGTVTIKYEYTTPAAPRRDRSRTVVTIPDEEVPLSDLPEFDIPEIEVPLGDAPEFEIEDEEVPLGELPVTGGMGVGLFLLAGAALAGAGASLRRKDEE